MKLTYVGDAPEYGLVPLPEGWPAADHEEPDEDLAKAKIESGAYKQETAKAAAAKTKE
jgi:hypothetical protein